MMSVCLQVTGDSAVVHFCFRCLIFSSLPFSVYFRLLVPSSKFCVLSVTVSGLSSSFKSVLLSSGSLRSCEMTTSRLFVSVINFVMSVRLQVTGDSAVVHFCFRGLIFSSLAFFRTLSTPSSFVKVLCTFCDHFWPFFIV